MLEAVIFDKDGVLMITEGAYHKATQHVIILFGGNGEKYSWEQHRSMMGWHSSERAQLLIKQFGLKVPLHDFRNRYRQTYFDILDQDGILVPTGVKELLEDLKRNKIPYAIGTGGGNENIKFSLEKSGLQEYFDVIVGADDVSQGKPHPETFQLAAERLGISKSQHTNCVVIGDSQNDIVGAKAAGMKVVAIVDPDYSEDPSIATPELRVTHFSQITLPLLQKLCN